MPVELPADCLRMVFEHFSFSNNLLRNFLLVSRLWCVVAIPVLWRNPFRQVRYYDIDTKFWPTFVRTIFACLPKISTNRIKDHVINKVSERGPLFDYVDYCQCISFEEVDEITLTLIGPDNAVSKDVWDRVEYEIWKLFLIRCKKIKYLEFSAETRPKTFYKLSKPRNDLKKITINVTNDNSGLRRFLLNQGGLVEASLTSTHMGVRCERISEGLCLPSSLKKLSLEGRAQIPSLLLRKLTNLRHLRITFEENTNSRYESLGRCRFPFLETFVVENLSGKNLSEYTKLIGNTRSLREIRIFTISSLPLHLVRPYWQSLYTNCTQLEFVTVWYKHDSLDDLKGLLISCGRLKGLALESNDRSRLNLDEVFEALVSLLRRDDFDKLKINGKWELNPGNLRRFLRDWGKRGQSKPLHICADVEMKEGLAKEIDKVFCEFAEDKVIREWYL